MLRYRARTQAEVRAQPFAQFRRALLGLAQDFRVDPSAGDYDAGPLFRSDRHLATAWLVGALLLALAAACSDAGSPEGAQGAPGKGVYVHAVWQSARLVSGHLVHMVGEKIRCNKCHELTSDTIGRVLPERCAACHAKEARIEHAAEHARQRFGVPARADCTMCHAFTVAGTDHDPTAAYSASDCRRCHTQAQGETPAVAVHHTSDCVACHKPHETDKPTSAPCNECHDMVPTHATAGKTLTAACTTCHQHQHAPAEHARGTCVECHAKQQPIVPATALFAQGHNECVGCHRPHEFKRTSAVACRSCHEDLNVLGARVPQHAQCTGCHSPHDVTASPDRACGNCHRDKHPDHPKHGVAGTCVGCHDPHPPSSRDARARRCSSCHQAAASDSAFHAQTPCRECHAPHDFVRAATDRSACRRCHAEELRLTAANRGHQTCEGCHAGLPHRPCALSVGCDACHGGQKAQVAPGHAKCTSCHEPHAGSVTTACRSCHVDEHKTAPAAHQDCDSCHQAHSGSLGKVRCATCHAVQAKTVHGRTAQGCNSCHRAHGPGGVAKPPPCSSCHDRKALGGLHQVGMHQDCRRCHTGHAEPTRGAARDACLACHTDRKNHFPEAPNCSSCHLFKKTR